MTDFVSVGFGDVRWPTFNVADSSIVIGILCFVALLTFFDREPKAAARQEPQP